MRVSVIMPAYNAGKTIGKAIESALSQKADVELIVIDDASGDATAETASRYPATVLKNASNLGPGPSRNRGIDAASGDCLLFLDADDELGANQLPSLLEAIEGHDVAYCPTLLVHRGRPRLIAPDSFEPWFLSGESLPIHSMLIRRDCCPRFDPAHVFEDREWASRMLLANMDFAFTPETCCLYNLGEPKERYARFAPVCRQIRKRLRNWLLSPAGGQKDASRVFWLACANLAGSVHDVWARGGKKSLTDDAILNIRQSARLVLGFPEKPDGFAENSLVRAFHMCRELGLSLPEINVLMTQYPAFAPKDRTSALRMLAESDRSLLPERNAMLATIHLELGQNLARLAELCYRPFEVKTEARATLDLSPALREGARRA